MRDLLSEWYNKAILFSSRFHIVALFDRQKIDFIHDTLMRSFPGKYFYLKPGQEISYDKINWIKSLLVASDHLGSVKALYEICTLIKYSQTLGEEIKNEFRHLQKDPFNLRSFLFELYVFRTLDHRGILNLKKPIRNGQSLEGFCTLNGQEFLFECKQLYMPRMDEFFVIQRLIKDFQIKSNNKSPLNGYMITITLTRPISEKHRIHFGQIIIAFYKTLPHAEKADFHYQVSDEFGEFIAHPFDREKFIAVEKKNIYDIIFYVEPTGLTRADGAVFLEGKVAGNFHMEHNKIYKKLETVLKLEKRQHDQTLYPRKIVFLASESYSEFQFGLFQHDTMFDMQCILAIHEKLKLKSILCFIRKYYQSDQPSVLTDVVYPEGFLPEAQILKHIFSSFGI